MLALVIQVDQALCSQGPQQLHKLKLNKLKINLRERNQASLVYQRCWRKRLKKVLTRHPSDLTVNSRSIIINIYRDKESTKVSIVSSVAVDVLLIPGSTAPIERVFSTSGHATVEKQNELTDRNLECEVLIRILIFYIIYYFSNTVISCNTLYTV